MKTVGGSRNRHVVMCIIIVCLSMQRLDHRMMRALGNSAVAFTISFFPMHLSSLRCPSLLSGERKMAALWGFAKEC